ncbi:propionyl-CoA carboxylase subunit alpha [Rickettsiales bacterium]|nr:propionyl-CoA carboxylase subunit alpha [Rickettsiales bacterium]
MFKKVLIANRGEIACRIIKTLKKMDIKSVAVFSDIDSSSKHAKMADEAICIGPAPSAQSYINIPNIINAIISSQADAVHPGFGFLSENAKFAEEALRQNVAFIGPQPEAIAIMGDKIAAKEVAKKHGVNIIAGQPAKDTTEAKSAAKEIGYPVMLKAAAGGGGKGIRIVHSADEIAAAFSSVANEAKNSFGDERIFLEKYIQNPRHIEIQILADHHGRIICLGERECSIQRRHQKVIEEAPSPLLDEKTRDKMYTQSIKLAKAINYQSAGTVEFIMEPNKNFYFLEMNTRLQVEHPVTEMITGVDLVEQMVRIAAGQPLSIAQEDIKINGWAMEARIYAEDRAFMPSTGRIRAYLEPEARPDAPHASDGGTVRIDSGIAEGDSITMFYDPMMAKLCACGKTRQHAIEIMQNSLDQFIISGVENNINFLSSVFRNAKFISGNISTNFMQHEYPGGYVPHKPTKQMLNIFLAVSAYIYLRRLKSIQTTIDDSAHLSIFIQGNSYDVVASLRDNDMKVLLDQTALELNMHHLTPGRMQLAKCSINGIKTNVKIEIAKEYQYLIASAGYEAQCSVFSAYTAKLKNNIKFKTSKKQISNTITSPISGILTKIYTQEGQKMKKGQPICIIEAMKMENTIYAEGNFTVKSILAKEGSTLSRGQAIINIDNIEINQKES